MQHLVIQLCKVLWVGCTYHPFRHNMSSDQPIEDLLEEFEAKLKDQKTRFQEELTASVTLHTKKNKDLHRKQISTLKRELLRIQKIIATMSPCHCKFRPAACNICSKIFKNRRTLSQHLKYAHHRSEVPLDGQTHNFNYQYPSYQGNGNSNSWGSLLPYSNYTPVANPSNPE